MSLIDRFVDAFDQVPRDESLGRIRVVPQGEELPEATIERLHSDQPLNGRDRQELRQWADAHGYDPDLLAEEKHLRMVEDCEYLNHRPVSEHWQVECNDEDVTVPATVGEWHRTNNSDYRIPVQWRHNRHGVQVHGMYGQWTVQASGEPIVADVPAADAVDTATEYMTSDSSPSHDRGQARNRVEAAADQYSQSQIDQNGVMKAYYDLENALVTYQKAKGEFDNSQDTGTGPVFPEASGRTKDPPDWFDAFPEQIGEYRRKERLPQWDDQRETWRPKSGILNYSKPTPEGTPVHRICVIRDDDGAFRLRELFRPDGDDIRVRRADAATAASDLIAYLRGDASVMDEKGPAPPEWPDWFAQCPETVAGWNRTPQPRGFDRYVEYQTDNPAYHYTKTVDRSYRSERPAETVVVIRYHDDRDVYRIRRAPRYTFKTCEDEGHILDHVHDQTALGDRIRSTLTSLDVPEPNQAAPNRPDWVDVFPERIDNQARELQGREGGGVALTYRYRQGGTRDHVCIYQRGGTFVCRIKGEWPARPVTDWDLVFQRDDVTAAANTLSQYLQHEVELAQDYDPDPDQVWPREDMFTADQP